MTITIGGFPTNWRLPHSIRKIGVAGEQPKLSLQEAGGPLCAAPRINYLRRGGRVPV